jgi:5'-nucleotidase
MRILISNDDGVYSAGISTLAEALGKRSDVLVIAPDRDRSGASNSLSVQIPVRVRQLANGYYSVTGTPTDCVHLAVTGLFKTKFDMVVSGINDGPNLGDDVIYSGTVAAAAEGGVLGVPSVAFSLADKGKQEHYDTAAAVAMQIIERLKKEPLPRGTILNVNVPNVSLGDLRGFEITRLGKRHPAQPAVKAIDPRGHPVYWIGAAGLEEDAGPGTDFYAIKENKVSITPIQLDMTDYTVFDKVGTWVSGLMQCKE